MHEHLAPGVYYLEVHLLYASIVCLAAWALTSLWKMSATGKYWIWVVTSLNFIVPIGGFFNGFGAAHVAWAKQLHGLDALGIEISRNLTLGAVLFGLWFCGAAVMVARLVARIRLDNHAARGAMDQESAPLEQMPPLVQGVPVRVSTQCESPSVAGVLHPHISLPQHLDRLLSQEELDAVLIHEVMHAKRRDNLIGLLQEFAQCALWFHPLVWLTGRRLGIFRELSCDDSVIARSRGTDLISALGKLAVPERPHLLRAGAASLLRHRVARLATPSPPANRAWDWLLLVTFASVFLACVLGTIAHYPSCFKVAI